MDCNRNYNCLSLTSFAFMITHDTLLLIHLLFVCCSTLSTIQSYCTSSIQISLPLPLPLTLIMQLFDTCLSFILEITSTLLSIISFLTEIKLQSSTLALHSNVTTLCCTLLDCPLMLVLSCTVRFLNACTVLSCTVL